MSEGFAPSRRALVMGGAVAAAALPMTASTASARPLAFQDAGDWQKHVGVTFAIAGEAGAAPMRLIEVKGARKMHAPSSTIRAHSFTAVFEMDAAQAPEGGRNYEVRHPELGTTGLYLQRANEGGKAYLRATFN